MSTSGDTEKKKKREKFENALESEKKVILKFVKDVSILKKRKVISISSRKKRITRLYDIRMNIYIEFNDNENILEILQVKTWKESYHQI